MIKQKEIEKKERKKRFNIIKNAKNIFIIKRVVEIKNIDRDLE